MLVGGGLWALVYAYHLWKIVPEMRAIWRAIDRSNHVRILGIIASPHVSPQVKEEAAVTITEIHNEEDRGKSRAAIPP